MKGYVDSLRVVIECVNVACYVVVSFLMLILTCAAIMEGFNEDVTKAFFTIVGFWIAKSVILGILACLVEIAENTRDKVD